MIGGKGALAGALAASLFLAGCASGEKVTLMPAAQDRPVGAVAVLDPSGGDKAVLTSANSQASLSAGSPRVRQLGGVVPEYQELIRSLPRVIELQVINFPTAVTRVSAEDVARLRATIESLGDDRSIYQIEIAGYTDSVGTESDNLTLSQGRANKVAEILRAEGFEIDQADVIGRGEYAAIRELGDNQDNQRFRAVTIKIR